MNVEAAARTFAGSSFGNELDDEAEIKRRDEGRVVVKIELEDKPEKNLKADA